jgi:hypothetical protein
VALRPVSELGLVDLTDLASPEKSPPARSKSRSAGSRPASGAKAQRTRTSPVAAPATPPRRRRAAIAVERASRGAVFVAPLAAGAAAGMLLVHAAVRR